MEISPKPWTHHKVSTGSRYHGDAIIRAADEEHGILGEVVAEVENMADAIFITERVNGKSAEARIQKALYDVVVCLRECKQELSDWLTGDGSSAYTEKLIAKAEEKIKTAEHYC